MEALKSKLVIQCCLTLQRKCTQFQWFPKNVNVEHIVKVARDVRGEGLKTVEKESKKSMGEQEMSE